MPVLLDRPSQEHASKSGGEDEENIDYNPGPQARDDQTVP